MRILPDPRNSWSKQEGQINAPPLIHNQWYVDIQMTEWNGAFPDSGPLAEDSATKLKRSQLNVCTMYVYGVLFHPPPPVAEICARLTGNFCQ